MWRDLATTSTGGGRGSTPGLLESTRTFLAGSTPGGWWRHPPSTETGTGSGGRQGHCIEPEGNVPNQQWLSVVQRSRANVSPGARRICHSSAGSPSGIVRMVLIGRASVRRISRRRSEEGQGEGGEGEVDGGPSVPIRLSTHDCRPRPTPLPPERPPPISRAVLSSEPNWYSTRGVHTHKKESSKGKRGGSLSEAFARLSTHEHRPRPPALPGTKRALRAAEQYRATWPHTRNQERHW